MRGVAGRSAVLPARRFRWGGAAAEEYCDFAGADMIGATRQVLAARSRGAAIGFDVRYFELGPAARTRLETHHHAHVVVVLRGTGRVRLGRRWTELRQFDACYVAPGTVHQLHNHGRRRFGFLCIVDAARDRGVPVSRARTTRRYLEGGAPSPPGGRGRR